MPQRTAARCVRAAYTIGEGVASVAHSFRDPLLPPVEHLPIALVGAAVGEGGFVSW